MNKKANTGINREHELGCASEKKIQQLKREITELKSSKKKLMDNLTILDLAFKHTLSPIAILDRNFNFIRVNDAYARADDRQESSFIGRNHFDMYPSEAKKIFEQVVETKKPIQVYARPFLYKENPERGVTFWDWTLVPILDDAEEVSLLVFSLNDVTRRVLSEKAMRKALREAQMRRKEFLAMLENSRAVVEHSNLKGAARVILKICKNMLGATIGYVCRLVKEDEEEPVYTDTGDQSCNVDPFLPLPMGGLRQKAYNTGRVVYENNFAGSEGQRLLPEGHVTIDNVMYAPLIIGDQNWGSMVFGNKSGGFSEEDARLATVLCRDAVIALYSSKLLEDLKSSEEYLRLVTQSANDAIISIDNKGKIIFWNYAAEAIFGYKSSEVMGRLFTLILPRSFQDLHRDRIYGLISGEVYGIAGRTFEITGLKKDGIEFPVEISISKSTSRGEACLTGIIRDITKRKQVEESMRLSEERFSIAFNVSPNPMAINLLSDWRYIDVNESFLQVTGYRRDEIVGYNAEELQARFDFGDHEELRKMILEQGRIRDMEARINIKSGKVREGLFSAEVINLRNGRYVLCVFNDLTERKQLEKEMVRLERLNLIGQNQKKYETPIKIRLNSAVSAAAAKSVSHFYPPSQEKCITLSIYSETK